MRTGFVWDSNSGPVHDVAVGMRASSRHRRFDLLGELLHSWASILRPQKPIRQGSRSLPPPAIPQFEPPK